MAFWDWFKRPDNAVVSISFDTEGLTVTRQASSVLERNYVRWDEVTLVVAYLKDCFTTDQIRLEFLSVDGGGFVITEDNVGFKALADSLTSHLPEIAEDWHLRLVRAPAFDPTIHTIFERES